MTTLCIIGSRKARLKDVKPFIIRYLNEVKPSLVISGGAEGVDSFAVDVADDMGYDTMEYLPACESNPHKETKEHYWKHHFKPRNTCMAEDCDVLVSIRSRRSQTYGSGWTYERAAELGKKTYMESVP